MQTDALSTRFFNFSCGKTFPPCGFLIPVAMPIPGTNDNIFLENFYSAPPHVALLQPAPNQVQRDIHHPILLPVVRHRSAYRQLGMVFIIK